MVSNHSCLATLLSGCSEQEGCGGEIAAHFMQSGSSEWREGFEDKINLSRSHPSVRLAQLVPTSSCPPPPNNAFVLWICEGINPGMRLECPGSNHFPKASPLNIAASGTRPSIHIQTTTWSIRKAVLEGPTAQEPRGRPRGHVSGARLQWGLGVICTLIFLGM
jgi:hypothetical protein